MKRSIPYSILLAFSLLACSSPQEAADKTVEDKTVADTVVKEKVAVEKIVEEQVIVQNTDAITDLLQSRLGYRAVVSEPLEMPTKGVYQVKFGDTYGYLVGDGRYLIRGDFIDLQEGKNYTELAKRDVAVETLAKFDDKDMIIYPAKGEHKATITVFTDTSCGYCRKLHGEASHLIDAGIQVQYLPFPRGSKRGPGYDTLQKVWCAKDRQHAMHVAKGTEQGDLDNDGSCEQSSVVDKGFIAGNAIGVTGTPSMFTESGKMIGGYVPYERLILQILNPTL